MAVINRVEEVLINLKEDEKHERNKTSHLGHLQEKNRKRSSEFFSFGQVVVQQKQFSSVRAETVM